MIFSNNFLSQKKTWISFSVILLGIYILPLWIYGDSLNILVFDNLDSNVVWLKVLAESQHIFSDNSTIIPNIMNGLPRSCFGSEYNILLWLYYFFTPFHAYAINETIMHLVAYFSMFVFLDQMIFDKQDPYRYVYISFGSLYFAILPFWPSAGLSIPLMPLVTYVLYQIKNNEDKWWSWAILVFLPLYSSFILVYSFYLLLAGLYLVRETLVHKTFNKRLFAALLLTTILFLLKEYRLLLQMFIEPSFTSNRTEYYSLVNKDFISAYRNALLEFLDGVPHAKGTHLSLLLPLSLFVLSFHFLKKTCSLLCTFGIVILFVLTIYTNFWNVILKQIYTFPLLVFILILTILYTRSKDLLPALLLGQILIALVFGFSFYKGFNSFFDLIPVFKMFNFSRFFFISSFLWGIIAALVIQKIFTYLKLPILIVSALFIAQLFISIQASFFNLGTPLQHLPFKNYYAQTMFDQIKQYIGTPPHSYRIVSLGIDPAVSQFNGFYTLDGYMVNYPLSYKHKFRPVISHFLEENKFYKDLYDGWGSKVYLFDRNVTYDYYNQFSVRSTYKKSYKNLTLDTIQLKKLGGDYLISAQKIETPEKYGLLFFKKFVHKDSLWIIYLYRIQP